jgi:hypothetical protein
MHVSCPEEWPVLLFTSHAFVLQLLHSRSKKYYFQFRWTFFSTFRHGIADSSEENPKKSQNSRMWRKVSYDLSPWGSLWWSLTELCLVIGSPSFEFRFQCCLFFLGFLGFCGKLLGLDSVLLFSMYFALICWSLVSEFIPWWQYQLRKSVVS